MNFFQKFIHKKYMNDLEKTVEKYPHGPWVWFKLSTNPNISWNFIQNHPNLPWVWGGVFRNPSVSIQAFYQFVDNPDNKYKWKEASVNFCYNPNINMKVVHNIRNRKLECDWCGLTENPSITWDDIQTNKHLPWCWDCLGANPNITWDIVQANPYHMWSYNKLSRNPNITWKIVSENKNKLWSMVLLSSNPSITWEDIWNNQDYPWLWAEVSLNPNIDFKIVVDHPQFPWSWSSLSRNPNITWEHVKYYPDKPWDYYQLTKNPNISSRHLPKLWRRMKWEQFKDCNLERFFRGITKGGMNELIPFFSTNVMNHHPRVNQKHIQRTLVNHPLLYQDILNLVLQYTGETC